MSSIFTRIIKREIPAYIIAEDVDNVAFLDISPLTKGHVLVVPKMEVDYIFDLPEHHYLSLHRFSAKVAKAIKIVTGKRIGTAVIGLEVPHAHIHLIPFTKMSELNFANAKLQLSKEEMSEIATEIDKVYKGLDS